MPFYERYWRIFLSKALWLNPLTVLFIGLVALGTWLTPPAEGSNLFISFVESVIATLFIMAAVALICTLVAAGRDAIKDYQKTKNQNGRRRRDEEIEISEDD